LLLLAYWELFLTGVRAHDNMAVGQPLLELPYTLWHRCPRGEKLLSQVHACIDTNIPPDKLMEDDNKFNDNFTYFKSLSRAEMVMSLFKILMF